MFSPALKKGSMELLILALLENRDRHGYEIGKLIETASGGTLVFRISSLYPTLAKLEDRGLVSGRWRERAGERRRRYYRLTSAGRNALEEQKQEFGNYVNAVFGVLENASGK